MNAIYILWLRQIKKYFRSPTRLIGTLGQPVLFLLALGYGLGPVFAQAGQGDYIQFLVPGVIAMGVLFTAMFSGIEIIWDKQFGFLKETLVAPVHRITIMLGRTLGGATIATFQGIFVLIISLLIGFRPVNLGMVIVALIFMFLIAILFTGLGTAFASTLEDMQGFQFIMNFVVMPTFFLSGALFPLANLPSVLHFITRINPLTYGVDGLRGALTGHLFMNYTLDIAVLALISALFLALGGYLFSKIKI
jgi:ABC-2 type transport system permease protein